MKNHTGLYKKLLTEQGDQQIEDTIAKDIARTFPKHILFRDDANGENGNRENIHNNNNHNISNKDNTPGNDASKSSTGRSALFNVLRAYAIHDKLTGYWYDYKIQINTHTYISSSESKGLFNLNITQNTN